MRNLENRSILEPASWINAIILTGTQQRKSEATRRKSFRCSLAFCSSLFIFNSERSAIAAFVLITSLRKGEVLGTEFLLSCISSPKTQVIADCDEEKREKIYQNHKQRVGPSWVFFRIRENCRETNCVTWIKPKLLCQIQIWIYVAGKPLKFCPKSENFKSNYCFLYILLNICTNPWLTEVFDLPK